MVCVVWEVSSRILSEPEGRAGIRFLLSFPAACNSLISDITSPLLAHQLNHALISIPPVRGFLPLLSFLSRQRSIARLCHLNTQPLQLAPIWLWCQFGANNLLDVVKQWHVWGILTEDEGESTIKTCSRGWMDRSSAVPQADFIGLIRVPQAHLITLKGRGIFWGSLAGPLWLIVSSEDWCPICPLQFKYLRRPSQRGNLVSCCSCIVGSLRINQTWTEGRGFVATAR